MADITLPLGANNINSRLYETGAHTVKSRQEVGDKQQEKKYKPFQERRKEDVRRKRSRRDKSQSPRVSQDRRSVKAEDRRVMERRGFLLRKDDFDIQTNKGRFVDQQV
ncbi:MAG: hypothetical protein COB51_05200 [Moraxellaceae bacterium]|nr:MAG: hypothetical protein COB51_05200 [Moraxellaceae bacterium]